MELTPTNPVELIGLWMNPEYIGVVRDVVTELTSQDLQWGQQDHPLIGSTVGRPWVLRKSYKALADRQKELNSFGAANSSLGWDDILLEEVFEALGEADPEKQIEELVQVAAVALNAAQAIRRNQRREAA